MRLWRKRGFAKPGLGVSAGLLVLAMPVVASAYVQSRTSDGWPTVWRSHAITIQFYSGEPPRFLENTSMMRMARASAATWSYPTNSCTDLTLNIVEVSESSVPAAYDMANRIGFRRGEWRKDPCTPDPEKKEFCDPYPGNAIAITTVTSNKRTGEILDADIELNAVTQTFADIVVDGPRPRGSLMTAQDLQNTLTHELGHFIGFDHNCFDPAASPSPPKDQFNRDAPLCSTASASIAEATMFNSALPGETKKRDLADDDLDALCDIYKPIDSGGCAFLAARAPSRRGGEALALAAIGLVATRLMARRRRR
ncbi:MAG TPA: hypothetical protein VGF45_09430 [Polyangia bacterium]